MTMPAETLYLQLRRLAASMPDLASGPIDADIRQWLGRAAVLVEAGGDLADLVTLKVSADSLDSTLRALNAGTIASVVYRTLARAESKAPASAQGAFIAAGDTLNAFAAVAKVLERAKKDILLVDAYADHVVLTDFAVTAPEGVQVRILGANKEGRKQVLRPAFERWVQQHGVGRPLEVRVAPASQLHDRLILIDHGEAWIAGQSFNGMAKSSHTSIEKSDPELGAMKVAAYEELWKTSIPL